MGREEMDIKLEETLLDQLSKQRKGGLKTMPFIIVNESFEKLASYGLIQNMIFYLMKGYNLEAATASSLLFIWRALSDSLAIFGALLSDAYLGRFWVIVLGSISSLLGMIFLWMTAVFPQLKPSPCDELGCSAPRASQIALLLFSFVLISIGAGCNRPCSIAFGADQLGMKENPNNERVLESYFSWYYVSVGISTIISFILVYIQDHWGWIVGFGIPTILMVFSALMFFLGSPLYIKAKPSGSLFIGFLQVLVATFMSSRDIHCPHDKVYNLYHITPDTKLLAPSEDFRCLNKACIVQDPETDLTSDGSAINPWNLCSVEQVESLKALLRIFPMWSSGLILMLTIHQSSFTALQAKTMNRQIFSSFEIPPGSFSLFMMATLTLWIILYDRFLAPLLARYTGNPQGLSPVTRMGVGLIMSSMAMLLAAVTERIRRNAAIEEGIQGDPNAVVNMSAMWLVPQAAFMGLAEALNAIALIEFIYLQFPKSMSSIAVAIFTFGMGASNMFGSVLVNAVTRFTAQRGNSSWLATNLNEGHLDYYYWLLCFLNLLNFLCFVIHCRKMRSKSNEASGGEPEYMH